MTAPPGQPLHTVQPPPSDDALTRTITALLSANLAADALAAAIRAVLSPWKVAPEAIAAALGIIERGSNHTPRKRGQGAVPTAAQRSELYFRAAYLQRAAVRIQQRMDQGTSLRDAIRAEGTYWDQHERARRQRLNAARAVAKAAGDYGQVLGWYLNPLLNNEPECIAANGHDFDATRGTVIGWPGSVHPGCGCYPGPPTGNGWVDDAVAPHIRFGAARKLRRKAA